MSNIENAYWQESIEWIKKTHSNIHLWYSSLGGWAYLSYKQNRERVTSEMTAHKITSIINSLVYKEL